MATKKPTPPRRTLEKLHEVGKNYTDIARRFGVSRTTVKNWFKEYGIYSPPGGRVIEPPTLETLDKLIAGGMSNDELAGKFQVHVTTVSLWLRTYGILSKKARLSFRRMTERLEKGVSKPEMPILSLPVAGYGAPQYTGKFEHQSQANIAGRG